MKKNSRFNGLSSCLGFNSKVFCETDINMVNFPNIAQLSALFMEKKLVSNVLSKVVVPGQSWPWSLYCCHVSINYFKLHALKSV